VIDCDKVCAEFDVLTGRNRFLFLPAGMIQRESGGVTRPRDRQGAPKQTITTINEDSEIDEEEETVIWDGEGGQTDNKCVAMHGHEAILYT